MWHQHTSTSLKNSLNKSVNSPDGTYFIDRGTGGRMGGLDFTKFGEKQDELSFFNQKYFRFLVLIIEIWNPGIFLPLLDVYLIYHETDYSSYKHTHKALLYMS